MSMGGRDRTGGPGAQAGGGGGKGQGARSQGPRGVSGVRGRTEPRLGVMRRNQGCLDLEVGSRIDLNDFYFFFLLYCAS